MREGLELGKTREWTSWEFWKRGWEMIEGHVHFEGEDIDDMLPLHGVVEKNPIVDGWVVRFPFENGWEGMFHDEYGPAVNAADVIGINRKLAGPGTWLKGDQYGNPSFAWPISRGPESDFQTLLDDPDDLVRKLEVISKLPPDGGRLVISIPGEVFATYTRGVITDLHFSPAASDAGYFGPAARLFDGEASEDLDLQQATGDFWSAVTDYLRDGKALDWVE